MLAVEVAETVFGDEESSEGAIAVEGDEPAALHVVLGAAAIGTFGNQDIFARSGIAEILGVVKILLHVDLAELAAVTGEMIFEQMDRSEARAGGYRCHCQEQEQRERGPTVSR